VPSGSASVHHIGARASLHLTRFGGHLILALGWRKESRYGTSVEVPGGVPA
jgi:hypothetical protein